MKRRFLAMLLSLVMVFAMLPVSAFAADDDAVTAPAAGDDNENVTTTDETDPTDDVKTDATDTNPSETDADDGDDVETNEDPTATATDPVLTVNFFADGAKGKAAKWGDDCERNTIRTVAKGLDSNENYVMTVTAPQGKYFRSDADSFTEVQEDSKATELVIGPAPTQTTETVVGAGWMFSIKPWAKRAQDDYEVDATDITGEYVIKLYKKLADTSASESTRANAEYSSDKYETNPLKTATLTLTKATVDFGTGNNAATSIYQEESRGYGLTEGYFFDVLSDDTTKATFYVDEADLTAGEDESARDVLLKLISFSAEKKTEVATLAEDGVTDSPIDNTRFPDGNGKKWVYNDSTRTFTYADVVTIKAAANDDNVEPPTETVLKKDGETFEVSVTANYLPKSDNATFTLKTADTTGDSAQKAVWTGTLKNASQISGTEVSVSAAPAVSVKAAAGVTLPSANVVTEQSAATQIAMFEITPADDENGTKATATITVTSDKQPEVTSPKDYGIFVVDNAENKTWKLVKDDAEATEITVGLKEELTAIKDLTATATRTPKGQSATITLDVTDANEEDVESFKYKLSEEEAEKPKVGATAAEADYKDYNKTAGFDYETGKDYVEVVTVNEYNEITAWGLAVIPKEKAEVVQAPSVNTGDDGSKTATANVDKKDVDTALEAAIQATPVEGATTTTAKLDFTTDANGDEVKADNAEITIPAESIDKIKEHNDQAESQDGVNSVVVEIATPAGDVTADEKVLEAIAGTETGVSGDATNVESTKVVLTIEKTVETDDTTATTKSEAFEIKFEKVVTFNDGTTEEKHVPVKVESSVKVSVPTTLNPASNKLFTYFKDTANKLFYAAIATVDSTTHRASFTAPHLSTYVMFEDEQKEGGIGVTLETETGSDPIIFDAQNEYTVTAATAANQIKIALTSDLSAAVDAADTSKATYSNGVFKLNSGVTSAKLIITRGTDTYTLTLNAYSSASTTTGLKVDLGTTYNNYAEIKISGIDPSHYYLVKITQPSITGNIMQASVFTILDGSDYPNGVTLAPSYGYEVEVREYATKAALLSFESDNALNIKKCTATEP